MGLINSSRRYQGPLSDHFNGKRFFNRIVTDHSGFLPLLKWGLTRKPSPWPTWVESCEGQKPIERLPEDLVRLTMINHATVLIQIAGLNIITDPVFSQRVSPLSWAGPKRVTRPGIALENLPPIDVILISHDHYDHLDVATLEALHFRDSPRIIAGLGVDSVLRDESQCLTCEVLDWWDSLFLHPDLKLRMVPAQHFSGRGLGDRDATLWGGYVLEGPGGPIWFAGDTGYGPFIQEIKAHYAAIRFALLPIGAYEPSWFMSPVHINPAEAVRIHNELNIHQSLAIHYGTFRLADDGYEQPLLDLSQALSDAHLDENDFQVLPFGEAITYAAQPMASLSGLKSSQATIDLL